MENMHSRYFRPFGGLFGSPIIADSFYNTTDDIF